MSKPCPSNKKILVGPKGGSYYLDRGRKVYCKASEPRAKEGKKAKSPVKPPTPKKKSPSPKKSPNQKGRITKTPHKEVPNTPESPSPPKKSPEKPTKRVFPTRPLP